jgi:glycosyltransferase involved in cell wall biosynthesis
MQMNVAQSKFIIGADAAVDEPIYRVAYLVTHPIQYQAPLLRLIANQPDIDLTVFFASDISLRSFSDPGFGRSVEWDISLIDGYRHEFLPALGRKDIVTATRPFSYGFAKRLRKSRFDALWVHGYARPSNLLAIAIAKVSGLKVFVRDEANQFSASRSPVRKILKSIFFRLLSRWVDGFLAIGSMNRDYYLKNGIKPGRIFMMPYAVDNDFFADRALQALAGRDLLRQKLGLEPGRKVILYASKFIVRKRPHELLRAYERLVNSMPKGESRPYLLYVGDGAMRAMLEAEAAAKGLRDVRFLGFRNQTELPALFDLSDIFVLVSSHEPWGLVVNEAMAAGCAVIVGDEVGCAADIVKPGINGFIVEPGDIAGLTDALREATSSLDRATAMGEAGRDIIRSWSFREDVAGLRAALRANLPQ